VTVAGQILMAVDKSHQAGGRGVAELRITGRTTAVRYGPADDMCLCPALDSSSVHGDAGLVLANPLARSALADCRRELSAH
jgi:hypothetical protein